jgi:hypothetical protein
MGRFAKICVVLGLLVGPVGAQETAVEVEWDHPDLQSARAEPTSLIERSAGFESAGASQLSRLNIPVIGVLPSEIGRIFAPRGAGFEGATDQELNIAAPTVTPVPYPDLKGYALPYQGIAEGLDAKCTGDRNFHEAPPGLALNEPAQTTGSEQQDSSTEEGEIYVASAQTIRYGVPYVCEVHCSTSRTRPYCETNKYAEDLLQSAVVLTAGTRD